MIQNVGAKRNAVTTRHAQKPGRIRRKRCHMKRVVEGMCIRLAEMRNLLMMKKLSTANSPSVIRPFTRASRGSSPKPPKGQLWETRTRLARTKRIRPMLLARVERVRQCQAHVPAGPGDVVTTHEPARAGSTAGCWIGRSSSRRRLGPGLRLPVGIMTTLGRTRA